MPESDKSVQDWSTEQKFVVVLEIAALNETQLAEYCRKKAHHTAIPELHANNTFFRWQSEAIHRPRPRGHQSKQAQYHG